MLIIILLCISLTTITSVNGMKDGIIAKKIDEYYSTIKCVANIAEDLIPEYNTFITCCGIWLLKDWFSSQVLDKCYEHNYHQINNLSDSLIPHINELCVDYPYQSISCKFLIITPITFIVLFILIIIFLITCGIVSCLKLRKVNKNYRYQQNLQNFESLKDQTEEEKKKIDV